MPPIESVWRLPSVTSKVTGSTEEKFSRRTVVVMSGRSATSTVRPTRVVTPRAYKAMRTPSTVTEATAADKEATENAFVAR